MKIAIIVASIALAAVGAKTLFCGECCCLKSRAASDAPSGEYVEARSASVFAGACHYNGEYVTAGREAVLAWHFDSGAWQKNSLAGVDVVAVVVANDNLAEAKSARRSTIYVDSDASPAQRESAVAWVRSQHANALGEIVAVEPVAVSVARNGERYDVRAGEAVELAGATMPDRACCSMPFNVWYEPFEKLDQRVVGCSAKFACHDKRLKADWTREGANDAFVGRFGKAKKVEVAAL